MVGQMHRQQAEGTLMSILASNVPGPSYVMWLIAVSAVMQERLHNSFGISSLTLRSTEWERSMINLYLLGLCCFGMTPNLLISASGMLCGRGQQHDVQQSLLWDNRLPPGDVDSLLPGFCKLNIAYIDGGLLKLTLKPSVRPSMTNLLRGLSGCLLNNLCHSLGCNGVVMAVASGGTLIEPSKWDVHSANQVL